MNPLISTLRSVCSDLSNAHLDRESGDVSEQQIRKAVRSIVRRLRGVLVADDPSVSNEWSNSDPEASGNAATLLGEAVQYLEDYLAGELPWGVVHPKALGRIESAEGYLNETLEQ